MHPPVAPLPINSELADWSAERVSVALALAAPNERRIAQAALALLTLDDHVAAHTAWSDAQAALDTGSTP